MSTNQSPAEAAQAARLANAVRERHRQRRLPNLPLLDQHGRTVYFYDDVMKGRQVLLGSMYTGCTNICTPATQNLIAARKLLGAQGLQLQFVSMTLTPLNDPPEALLGYIKQHGIDTPWTFLKAAEKWKGEPNPAVSAIEASVSSPEAMMRCARARRERRRYCQGERPVCSRKIRRK